VTEKARATGRPREAILSRNLIRDQALAIIDEEGLASLTMRRLAARLGVQAASLCAHFPNKEAVLDAIAERLAKRIDPTGFGESWQEGLRTWANSYYAAIHWHPNAAPVIASGAHERSDYLAAEEQIHRELVAYGWPDRDATMVAVATKFLVLGAATAAGADAAPRPVTRAGRTSRPGSSPLDQFADTIDKASFTLALDSLIVGLETVHGAALKAAARSAGATAS
jgi:AcrR family transcriptional regulator